MTSGTMRLPRWFGRAVPMHAQHAALRVTFARAREACKSASAGALGLRLIMSTLRDALVTHFDTEESEEFFGTLETECPDLRGRVAALRAEHVEMTAAIDAILQVCDRDERRAEIASNLERLWERLDKHEEAELALLEDFFLRPPS